MELNQTSNNWYDKKWLVYLLCIVFFPVGLYALWKNQSISKFVKIGVSALIGIIVIASMNGNKNSNSTSDATTETQTKEEVKTELTQTQKDSIASEEAKTMIKEREDNTIKARDLTASYAANEVQADENFKGKEFYVEGTVSDIKKDIMDDIYVILEGDEFLRDVQCYFDDKNTASQLQKGMRVTFKGKCDGLMMNVQMKNCEIAENLSDLKKKAK